MPSSHKALQNLLRITEEQLRQIEKELMETRTPEETTALIEAAAELHLKRRELLVLLSEGDIK